ncbi:MAG: tRNA pseudouridine(38-40) synthase TruA [Micrococcaceae bacterium]
MSETVNDQIASEPMMRIRIDLAYDGESFHGWAVQPGLASVQGAVEAGLQMVIRRSIRTTVAGRTDAGVHAAHQVIHCDLTPEEWNAVSRQREGVEPEDALVRRLNGVLRAQEGSIVIRSAAVAPVGFDARFSAGGRAYRYRISDRLDTRDPLQRRFTHWHGTPLSLALMQAEADSMLGLHDFLSYCKPREGATTIRTLRRFDLYRDALGVIHAELEADAFCHNMVRALVGSAMLVGEGKRPPGWMEQRRAEQRRGPDVRLAPARGLVLERIDYPETAEELAEQARRTRARRSVSMGAVDES